eukprot:Tbor_TRINITY_DN5546_c1_g1::TRINITY_DN5546_c1_g1_i2::g.12753::m.12753
MTTTKTETPLPNTITTSITTYNNNNFNINNNNNNNINNINNHSPPPTEILYLQPPFLLSMATLILLINTQTHPNNYLPKSLHGRLYYGTPIKTFLIYPISLISISYLAIADNIHNGCHYMGGHTAGYLLSCGVAFGLLYMRKLSYIWPGIGAVYGLYGYRFHYSKLSEYYEGQPIINISDMNEIIYDIVVGKYRARVIKESNIISTSEQETMAKERERIARRG